MSERRDTSAAVALMRGVHANPGVERATMIRALGLPSGFAAETIARLTALQLLEEQPAHASGARGRPTTTLHPHPRGPLVVVAAISHETWRVATIQLGGATRSSLVRPHRRRPEAALAGLRAELQAVRRRLGGRLRAVAISVPGTVSGTRLTQAASLGWHDVELASLWPNERSDRVLLTGNDGTFAAVAESRLGSAARASTSVHLFMDAGIGGAVIEHGRALLGARGMAGEFGHLPFGDPALRCGCGAWGCWNTALEPEAIARLLHEPTPEEGVTYTRAVLAAAAAGQEAERRAVRAVALSVGRGAAGLANALDPDLVTVGGLGRELMAVAGDDLQGAYLAGLMQWRATPPPPLVAAQLGDEAPLVGAGEEAFSAVLTDDGLAAWARRLPARAARGSR